MALLIEVVLDASIGQPAPNVSIKLEMLDTGALAGQPHANVLASGCVHLF